MVMYNEFMVWSALLFFYILSDIQEVKNKLCFAHFQCGNLHLVSIVNYLLVFFSSDFYINNIAIFFQKYLNNIPINSHRFICVFVSFHYYKKFTGHNHLLKYF